MRIRVGPPMDKEVRAYLRSVKNAAVPSAAAQSLTATARYIRKLSIRGIALRSGLQTATVRKRLYVVRARPNKLQAAVGTSTKWVPATSDKRTRQNKTGVLAFKKQYRRAWIGERKDGRGGAQAFQRINSGPKSRYPLRVIRMNFYAYSAPVIQGLIRGQAAKFFDKDFKRVLGNKLKKMGKKRGAGSAVASRIIMGSFDR